MLYYLRHFASLARCLLCNVCANGVVTQLKPETELYVTLLFEIKTLQAVLTLNCLVLYLFIRNICFACGIVLLRLLKFNCINLTLIVYFTELHEKARRVWVRVWRTLPVGVLFISMAVSLWPRYSYLLYVSLGPQTDWGFKFWQWGLARCIVRYERWQLCLQTTMCV